MKQIICHSQLHIPIAHIRMPTCMIIGLSNHQFILLGHESPAYTWLRVNDLHT